MSSSPWERLWNGDEDVATPLRAGAISRCAGSMTPPARRIRARLAEACLKIKGLDAPARAAIAKEGKKP